MATLNEKVTRDGAEMVALERREGLATVAGQQYKARIELVKGLLWQSGSYGVVVTVWTPAGEKYRKVWAKTEAEAAKTYGEQAEKLQ